MMKLIYVKFKKKKQERGLRNQLKPWNSPERRIFIGKQRTRRNIYVGIDDANGRRVRKMQIFSRLGPAVFPDTARGSKSDPSARLAEQDPNGEECGVENMQLIERHSAARALKKTTLASTRYKS